MQLTLLVVELQSNNHINSNVDGKYNSEYIASNADNKVRHNHTRNSTWANLAMLSLATNVTFGSVFHNTSKLQAI